MTELQYIDSLKSRIVKSLKVDKSSTKDAIMRYLFERFMYRVVNSKYKDNFILRGSNLLYIYTKENTRYTKDIDYMGIYISNNPENMKEVFKEICNIKCPEDYVFFDSDTIKVESINHIKKYMGARISIIASFGKIKEIIKFDIGYDDVITPDKKLYKYPIILNEMPGFELYAYTIETALAEKIHSIIYLAEETTRMKDFYDIKHIIENIKIDYEILDDALTNTFNHRNTKRDKNNIIFNIDYYLNENRIKLWRNFIMRSKLEFTPFIEIGKFIIKYIKPLL